MIVPLLSLAAIGYAASLPTAFKDASLGYRGKKTAPEQLHFNYARDHGMMIS